MATALQAFFKDFFIPHQDNDHQPHLLRPRTVWFVLMVVLVAQAVLLIGSTYVAPRSRLFGEILVNALVDETNQNRTVNNEPALRVSPVLQAAAQEKANDMATNNYFAHTSPAGLTPWYWFQKVGYNFAYAGENLAVNFVNSEDVTNAWMNSPDHRENILNGNFTEIGMATAEGTFEGRPATYVVELFGTPAAQPIAFVNEAAAAQTPSPAPKPAPKPVVKPKPSQPSVVTVVANNTTTNNSSSQLTFVAVKGAEAVNVPAPAPQTPAVSTPMQRLFANPATVVNYFYLILMALFAVGLGTHVFAKMELHHPKLMFGGLLVIVVAGLFLMLNQHPGLFYSTIL